MFVSRAITTTMTFENIYSYSDCMKIGQEAWFTDSPCEWQEDWVVASLTLITVFSNDFLFFLSCNSWVRIKSLNFLNLQWSSLLNYRNCGIIFFRKTFKNYMHLFLIWNRINNHITSIDESLYGKNLVKYQPSREVLKSFNLTCCTFS